MCYSQGTLQAFLDGEMNRSQRGEVEEHLRSCPECAKLLESLRAAERLAGRGLDSHLEDSRLDVWESEEAWDRLQTRLRPFRREAWFEVALRYRAVTVGVAAVLVLAIGLSFGPVRAVAGRFLSIFRVTRFETIAVAPDLIARVQEVIRQGFGLVKIGELGEVEFESSGPRGLVSRDQAKQALGFPLRLPTYLPAELELQGLKASPNASLSVTLDVAKANELLRSLGGETMLPDELDGEKFVLRVPASVEAQFGGQGTLYVLQAKSPELDVPGNTSPAAVRDAVLGLPFIPDSVKRQIRSVDDWQHTFLVPNVEGSTQEITVEGVAGVFVTLPEEYREDSIVNIMIWEKDGVVYAVTGQFSLEEALLIGNSME
ncbi:MAG: anti-sigma factor family protein [Bacillota bacterium]